LFLSRKLLSRINVVFFFKPICPTLVLHSTLKSSVPIASDGLSTSNFKTCVFKQVSKFLNSVSHQSLIYVFLPSYLSLYDLTFILALKSSVPIASSDLSTSSFKTRLSKPVSKFLNLISYQMLVELCQLAVLLVVTRSPFILALKNLAFESLPVTYRFQISNRAFPNECPNFET